MEIEIKIDSSCKEPKIIVVTDILTDEVKGILKKLSEDSLKMIAGFRDETLTLLEQADIIRIYTYSGKVAAVTDEGEYTLRLRLYELEERLDQECFVRISNSEIINLKKVKGFDLSFSGTICVKMCNGTVTYVSRRYITKIKRVLGI